MIRINENRGMIENRAYLLLNSWFQKKHSRNGLGVKIRLTRPINRERPVTKQMQQRGLKQRI